MLILADYCAFVKRVLDGQWHDKWSSCVSVHNSPLHVRCYLTDPSSPIQLSDSPASPFPEKREWVRLSLLVAKTLFHHQASLCDWTGQDLALHASSIFSTPSIYPLKQTEMDELAGALLPFSTHSFTLGNLFSVHPEHHRAACSFLCLAVLSCSFTFSLIPPLTESSLLLPPLL